MRKVVCRAKPEKANENSMRAIMGLGRRKEVSSRSRVAVPEVGGKLPKKSMETYGKLRPVLTQRFAVVAGMTTVS